MGVKKYFRREFSKDMFFFEHDSAPDFYLSSWQRNRSVLPMLFIRTIIFSGCASIVIASMIITTRTLDIGSWFIFLTHWGLILNTLASGFALVISIRVSLRGHIDGSLELPWFIKTYWAFYNISTPIAFFISVFYFAMLADLDISGETYGMDPVLDVFIHLVNSLLMLALVVASRHGTRLLHFYWSICFGLIYMIFTVIFHLAGGESPFGSTWIYPMLDWSKPGPTIGVVIGSAFGLLIMHIIVVLITLVRDKLTQRFRETNSLYISTQRSY